MRTITKNITKVDNPSVYRETRYLYCDELTTLVETTAKLQEFKGYENIIDILGKKILSFFEHVKERKDGAKLINDYLYYPNGVLYDRKNGYHLMITPWTPSKTKNNEELAIETTNSTYDFLQSPHKDSNDRTYGRRNSMHMAQTQMIRLSNKKSRKRISKQYYCCNHLVDILKEIQAIELLEHENTLKYLVKADVHKGYGDRLYRDRSKIENYRNDIEFIFTIFGSQSMIIPGTTQIGYLTDEACNNTIKIYRDLNGPGLEKASGDIAYNTLQNIHNTINNALFKAENYKPIGIDVSEMLTIDHIIQTCFYNGWRSIEKNVTENDAALIITTLVKLYNCLYDMDKSSIAYKIIKESGIIDVNYVPDLKYSIYEEVEIIE